jgi:cytochrome c oxidase subunit IV
MAAAVTPRRTYVLTGVALLILTALTYGVSRVNLGAWGGVVALGIAVVKAALIILVFMHARHSLSLTRLVILVSVAMLLGLIIGTLDDYVTRAWISVPGK